MMKRIVYMISAIALSVMAMQAEAQVSNGLYRALTDANSARVVALGGLPLPLHDGDLQTAVFNPSAISPEMHNQLTLSYVGDFNLETNFGTVQYSRTFEKMGSFATMATCSMPPKAAMSTAAPSRCPTMPSRWVGDVS